MAVIGPRGGAGMSGAGCFAFQVDTFGKSLHFVNLAFDNVTMADNAAARGLGGGGTISWNAPRARNSTITFLNCNISGNVAGEAAPSQHPSYFPPRTRNCVAVVLFECVLLFSPTTSVAALLASTTCATPP